MRLPGAAGVQPGLSVTVAEPECHGESPWASIVTNHSISESEHSGQAQADPTT